MATIKPSNFIEYLKKNVLWNVIDTSQDSVVITDKIGTIIHVNDFFCQVSGYSREELLGNNPRILKSGAQDNSVYKNLWKTIKAGDIWSGRFCNRNKQGGLYWEDVNIYPIQFEDTTYFVGIKKDITKQVIVQSQLQDTQNTLQTMIDAVKDVLLMIDRNFNVVAANQYVANLFGMALEDFKRTPSKNWYRLKHI